MHEHCAGMFVTQTQMQIRSSPHRHPVPHVLSVKGPVYHLDFFWKKRVVIKANSLRGHAMFWNWRYTEEFHCKM